MKRALLLLLLSLSCAKVPEAPALKARVLDQVASWKSYRAVINSTVHVRAAAGDAPASTMNTTLQIDAVLPNRMRLEGAGEGAGQRLETIMTFDGGNVLATMLAGGAPQMVRVDQKLAPPERPFDTGFSMRGFGLFEGRDLQGSIRDLLSQWRYTAVTNETFQGKRCFGLRGTLDVEAALDELTRQLPALESAQIAMMAPVMAQGLKAMSESIVFVTEEGAVLGWTLHAGGQPMVESIVVSFTRDAPIAPERLAIDPIALAKAIDVTEQARASRAAPVDAATHEAFKDKVRGLLAP